MGPQPAPLPLRSNRSLLVRATRAPTVAAEAGEEEEGAARPPQGGPEPEAAGAVVPPRSASRSFYVGAQLYLPNPSSPGRPRCRPRRRIWRVWARARSGRRPLPLPPAEHLFFESPRSPRPAAAATTSEESDPADCIRLAAVASAAAASRCPSHPRPRSPAPSSIRRDGGTWSSLPRSLARPLSHSSCMIYESFSVFLEEGITTTSLLLTANRRVVRLPPAHHRLLVALLSCGSCCAASRC